jgi:SPP1 gp7 family putative phage head morphogenesis protein
MDRFKKKILIECLPVVRNIYEDLFDQIEAKKILKDQKVDRIDTLKVKYLKDVKLILKRNLREAYLDGKLSAKDELLKGTYRTPLADDKFLEILEAESFQYIGDWAYNITKGARIALMEAIRDGKPLSAVIDFLEEHGMEDSLTSLERFSRTKITDVMNRGRMAFYNESGVVAAYQYSAILDDRTTDICSGLDGKVFKDGDAPIPPMHFNCRSLLIPITKYEDYEADEFVGKVPIDQFIDDNKGDGFSKQ